MAEPVLVRIVESGVNWGAVEAIGSLLGLATAIAVPAWFEAARVRREKQARREQTFAILRVLDSVINVLAEKTHVSPGEVDEMSSVLANLDLRALNSEAVEAVVRLRNRVAASAASARGSLMDAKILHEVPYRFDADRARAELEPHRPAFEG